MINDLYSHKNIKKINSDEHLEKVTCKQQDKSNYIIVGIHLYIDNKLIAYPAYINYINMSLAVFTPMRVREVR